MIDCVFIFVEVDKGTSEIAFHLILFIILALFYLYTLFKPINEHIYENYLCGILFFGVIFKIIYDWVYEDFTDLSFAFSSAIIPIFFTLFEFSF